MKNVLIVTSLLPILIGCASTRVVNHDFKTVAGYIEDKYEIDFQGTNEWDKTSFFIFDSKIQLKEYEENKILKLKKSADFLGKSITTLTLIPETGSETKVKVSMWSFWLIAWKERQNEINYLDRLEEGLNKEQNQSIEPTRDNA